MSKFSEELEKYMDAVIPILYIDTLEYDKIENQIAKTAERFRRRLIKWTQRGLNYVSDNAFTRDISLSKALDTLLSDEETLTRSLVIIEDVHFFLEKPEVIARLRELSHKIMSGAIEDCTFVLVAPMGNIPRELESYLTIIEPDFLTENDIKKLIERLAREQGSPQPNGKLLGQLAKMLKGLSETEINNVIALAMQQNNVIDRSDLLLIQEQKKQKITKSGILEMIAINESMEDIGGLENLKSWLMRKRDIFANIEEALNFGVDIPKGVLIAGMPGCGKSLAAKATAKAFEMTLLRMDMGRLMGKYVGESELNMRRAIQLTEASSPCVLWIDELEKAFAGVQAGGGGSEVTTRLFGNFLTWMQEKKDSLAFVVATANDISKLPPELLRKGRFDEIFYVGLPNKEERRQIFKIHIKKRRGESDLNSISLDSLVDKTEGYCGADIEGVVKEAVESAFVNKQNKLNTKDLTDAINSTNPISETMKEQIEAMAKQYKNKKFTNASR